MTVRDCTADAEVMLVPAAVWQTGRFALSQVLSQRLWAWIALIWLVAILPAKAELELRVAIEQDVGQVKVGGSTEAILRDGSGQVLAQVPAMNAVVAEV